MATLYVAPSGDDANPGSASAPWQTLQKAADAAQPGDTVVVRAGEYEGFYLDHSGTASQCITFHGEKGAAITAPNANTPDGINLEGADCVTIEGFTVNNMPRAGIRSVTNQQVVIRNNTADSNGVWGIFTAYSDDVRIEGNVTSRSQEEHGIYVSNSGDRPIIRGNISWGNNVCGIHMNGDVEAGDGDGIISRAIVEGNTIYDNGRGGGSGINADGVQNSVFQNNLLYNNHASGISLFRWNGAEGSSWNKILNNTIINADDARWALNIQDGSTNNTVLNNVLYNRHSYRGSINVSEDSRPGFTSDYNAIMNRFTTDDSNVISLDQWRSDTGQDRHSMLATPEQLFVDATADNYQPSATSLALDHGTTLYAPTNDMRGTPRPSGAGVDIGAVERAVASQTNSSPAAPSVNNFGGAISYRENASGTVVTWGFVSDPDSPDFANGRLVVRLVAGAEAADRLTIRPTSNLSVAGNQVAYQGQVIGTFSGGMGANALVVNLNSNATPTSVTALMRNILYRHAWENPRQLVKTLSVQLSDGDGATSSPVTKQIYVTAINDAPVLLGGGTMGYTLGSAAIRPASNFVLRDPDSTSFAGGQLSVSVVSGDVPANRLAVGGAFRISNGNLLFYEKTIGTIGGNFRSSLNIAFNANATRYVVEQLIRSIRFRTVDGTSTVSRVLQFGVSDCLGGIQSKASCTINVRA